MSDKMCISPKKFKREKTLKQHLLTVHAPAGDKPNFLCVYCGKSFESSSGELVGRVWVD